MRMQSSKMKNLKLKFKNNSRIKSISTSSNEYSFNGI